MKLKTRVGHVEMEVLDALSEDPNCTMGKMFDEMGREPFSIRASMRRLFVAGYVQKTGKAGRWVCWGLTESGSQLLKRERDRGRIPGVTAAQAGRLNWFVEAP